MKFSLILFGIREFLYIFASHSIWKGGQSYEKKLEKPHFAYEKRRLQHSLFTIISYIYKLYDSFKFVFSE